MPHRKLTQAWVAKAQALPGAERTIFWDESLEGFGLMVTAAGHKSWVVQYRAAGHSRRYTLKGSLKLGKARKAARSLQGRVAEGADPVAERRKVKAEATNTLKAIAEDHLRREKRRLRSIGERRRILERYVYPRLGSHQIDSIKRSEVVRLLDQVEDHNGAVMADHVLAVVRRLMSWHASRSDEFRSPIVRGMSRSKPKERARERVLSDAELRVLWEALEAWETPYAHLVRFLLLTAVRLREASLMLRREVTGSEWVIPAARHKSKRQFLVPLSKAAREVLAAVPVVGRKGWVFTGDGDRPIGGFSKFKRHLDKRILEALRRHNPKAEPVAPWVLHDLRRTAKSLMSRAGVPPNHSERALGHVIPGVEGTYDRYSYAEEKRRALEALADQVKLILKPAGRSGFGSSGVSVGGCCHA